MKNIFDDERKRKYTLSYQIIVNDENEKWIEDESSIELKSNGIVPNMKDMGTMDCWFFNNLLFWMNQNTYRKSINSPLYEIVLNLSQEIPKE